MDQDLDDIADLAEDLGIANLENGVVNVENVAANANVDLVEGHYKDYFIGQLTHKAKRFYIVLNLDKISTQDLGRKRFTIAHELGHFFIDSHRSKLAKGESLSFKGNVADTKKIEVAANHFAANLLMPPKIFREAAISKDSGLQAIYELRQQFDTSLEATAIHYVKMNVAPCILIRWKAGFAYQYAIYNYSFSKLTGIKGKPPIKINVNHLRSQTAELTTKRGHYIEDATLLSRWVSTITPKSKKDLVGLEQTMKLGEFGGLTLLTF